MIKEYSMNFSNLKYSIVWLSVALFAPTITMFCQLPWVFLGTWENATNRKLVYTERGIPHDIKGKTFLNEELIPSVLHNEFDATFSDPSDRTIRVMIVMRYNKETHELQGTLIRGNTQTPLTGMKVNPSQIVVINGILSGPKLEDSAVTFEVK